MRRLLTVAGALAAWPVLAALLPQGLPPGIMLLGAVLGALTGLTAMGLVLIYRATRIVNFAQAALGSAAGVFAVLLFSAWGVNYFVAFAIGLVIAGAAGAAVDRLVIRRFFWAPRLILTLATIGLAQVLGGIELVLPRAFGKPLVLNSFTTPLSAHFSVHPILFTGSHVLVLVAVPAAGAGVAWLLRRTAVGRGIRASADNAERALLLGVPVRRLSTIVWATAAALSALAVMLTAPLQPVPPTVLAGPTLLLAPLAAAVIARMERLDVAFAAGVGIGIVQQATFWNTSRGSLSDVALLLAILVALLLQRDRLARSEETDASSWIGAHETPPVPRALRALPEIVWSRRGLIAVAVLAAVLLPDFVSVSQLSLVGTIAATYALVGVSLVVLTGWAGQLSLGQFAMTGAGAVATANLVVHRVDLLIALPAAAAAGAAIALLVGLPALRIRGLFLGVTTLALSVAMSTYFLNPSYFAWALPSDLTRPRLVGHFDLGSERTLYYFALAVLGLTLVAARGLRSGRPGRALVAVRDNEPAAAARAIHPIRVKLMAFAISGAIAGLAGAIHVLALNGIRNGAYSPAQSFEAFSIVVVGGLTSVTGAVGGAVLLRTVEYLVGGGVQLVVTGAGVLVLLLVLPGGMGQIANGLRVRAFEYIARRRQVELDDADRPDLEDVLVS